MRIPKITNYAQQSFNGLHIKKDKSSEYYFDSIKGHPASVLLCLDALNQIDKESRRKGEEWTLEIRRLYQNSYDMFPDFNLLLWNGDEIVNNRICLNDEFWDSKNTIDGYKKLVLLSHGDIESKDDLLNNVFDIYA